MMAEKETKKKKETEGKALEATAKQAAEAMTEMLLQQALDVAARIEAGKPIRLDVDLPEHEGEWVEFVGKGWRFKDLREYEGAIGAELLGVICVRRIVDWNLKVDGEKVIFTPKAARDRLEKLPEEHDARTSIAVDIREAERTTMDELTPDLVAFIWGAYRIAYNLAGTLSPN